MSVLTSEETPLDMAPREARRTRGREQWGSPVTYFIAFLFIALCLGPVLYIVIGGFRDNSQITSSPAGFPSPWRFDNYLDVLTSSTF